MGGQSHTGIKLNTSGAVPTLSGSDTALNHHTWDRLSPFTQGYVEALFSEAHQTGFFGRKTLRPEECRFDTLAPETLVRIIADCAAMIPKYPPSVFPERHSDTGRAFWITRQAGEIGPAFPPLNVQLGVDGKVKFAKATGERAPVHPWMTAAERSKSEEA